MKKVVLISVLSLSPLLSFADAGLAKSKACLACHQVEKKVVGPAFKDVAAKYQGQDGASSALALKIKNGTKGVWGPIAMPPQNGVSDEEAEILAKWVLSQ